MTSQQGQFSNLDTVSNTPENPQDPPPPYSDHAVYTSDSSSKLGENSPLYHQHGGDPGGEKQLPKEPGPPPYSSNGNITISRPTIVTQPQGYQQQQAQPQTGSQNQYAPSQGGCCDLCDEACAGCLCVCFMCECCAAFCE